MSANSTTPERPPTGKLVYEIDLTSAMGAQELLAHHRAAQEDGEELGERALRLLRESLGKKEAA